MASFLPLARTSPSQHRPRRSDAVVGALAIALVLLLSSLEGIAVDDAAPSGETIDLERLLQLPDSFDAGGERRAGATESEWRDRFLQARQAIDGARSKLEQAQQQLEELAGDTSTYQVSAPGANEPQNSPVSLKLRQDIRSGKEQLEGAEKRLRALGIEANLASVPDNWRH